MTDQELAIELMLKFGTKKRAADAMGVARSSMSRWVAGQEGMAEPTRRLARILLSR